MSYYGKIVEGVGHASKRSVQILVTLDEGNRVSGYIMGSTGRPTRKKEKILARDFFDHATGILHKGGWVVIHDSLPPKPQSLTGTLRDMNVGDKLVLSSSTVKPDTIRNLAARLNVNLDRKYTVNRDGDAYNVERLS